MARNWTMQIEWHDPTLQRTRDGWQKPSTAHGIPIESSVNLQSPQQVRYLEEQDQFLNVWSSSLLMMSSYFQML